MQKKDNIFSWIFRYFTACFISILPLTANHITHNINQKQKGDTIEQYKQILDAVNALPFNLGRESLTKYLKGELTDTIAKHNLDTHHHYGVLSEYHNHEIKEHLQTLETQSLLISKQLPHSQARIISLTPQGKTSIKTGRIDINTTLKNPSTTKNDAHAQFHVLPNSPATEKELTTINTIHFFLKHLDKNQAHATICDASHILCVAGAGSGKTTVLTKRIEFLTTYKSINPTTILAITFTKKARDEMRSRLDQIPSCTGVHIETFNSLCERLLRQLDPKTAERPMLEYKDKFELIRTAIIHTTHSEDRAFDTYFNPQQLKSKSKEELLGTLVFDVFSILEHYKNEEQPIEPFYNTITDLKDKTRAKLLHALCILVRAYASERHIRDYTDQIIDVITLLTKNPSFIPKYTHILVDEFQDTSSLQIKLLDLLHPENLFCVGDPRQSIYEWRGSKPAYLYDFPKKHPASKIIHLTTNYRSTEEIVELANKIVGPLRLPDLISSPVSITTESSISPTKQGNKNDSSLQLIEFSSEESEWDFIVREIEQSQESSVSSATTIPLHHIFVLARTNKQLSGLSFYLQLKKIPHILKTDETRNIHLKENHLTLATIHAIKGLEAKRVYVLGCTSQYFPCKVSDHPVLDNLKKYDTEQEERRLFYVAITRAKKQLILTYASKNPTYFLTAEAKKICETVLPPQPISTLLRYQHITKTPAQTLHILRDWRNSKAEEQHLEKYMILHDKTLQQIAISMPLNTDDLKTISGMGPIKIHKYGQEILSLIKTVN